MMIDIYTIGTVANNLSQVLSGCTYQKSADHGDKQIFSVSRDIKSKFFFLQFTLGYHFEKFVFYIISLFEVQIYIQ